MKNLRKNLRPALLYLSVMGAALMTGPIVQTYYPIEQAQQDLSRTLRRTGRRITRKINLLTA